MGTYTQTIRTSNVTRDAIRGASMSNQCTKIQLLFLLWMAAAAGPAWACSTIGEFSYEVAHQYADVVSVGEVIEKHDADCEAGDPAEGREPRCFSEEFTFAVLQGWKGLAGEDPIVVFSSVDSCGLAGDKDFEPGDRALILAAYTDDEEPRLSTDLLAGSTYLCWPKGRYALETIAGLGDGPLLEDGHSTEQLIDECGFPEAEPESEPSTGFCGLGVPMGAILSFGFLLTLRGRRGCA